MRFPSLRFKVECDHAEAHNSLLQENQSKTIDRLTNLLETSISKDRDDKKSFLDISASFFAPMLAVGALLIYTGVALTFDQFYTRLGVSPGDVGLSYSSILAGSVGIVVYGTVAYLLGVGIPIVIFYPVLKIRRQTHVIARMLKSPPIYLGFIFTFMFAFLVGGNLGAIRAADAVMQGRPVVPGKIGPVVTALGGGAKPVVIMAIGKGVDAPNVSRLSSSRLFYLGQANSTVVLYDSTNRQAIYLPSAAVRMNIINCLAPNPRRPFCDNAYGS